MDYGIANQTGKPNIEMAKNIVSTAWEGGIRHFDTAQAYGESEQVLGKILADLGIGKQAYIITKPDPNINYTNKKRHRRFFKKSLGNLKCDHLYGLMLHREDFLDLFEKGLADKLETFLKQGLVEKIGISLLHPK